MPAIEPRFSAQPMIVRVRAAAFKIVLDFNYDLPRMQFVGLLLITLQVAKQLSFVLHDLNESNT
jgi:hypothetical protein